MSDIEQKIDELYQLAPGEFTAARNALAKMFKGADAARVKALAKPAAVPWAVNQLYWRKRPAYDQLLAAGRALREAQIAALGGRGGEVGRANDVHRKALADAVRDAISLASAHGVKPAPDQLARMLEVLSLRPATSEAPGRCTDLVQSSGLEALAGITVAERAGDSGDQSDASRHHETTVSSAPGAKRSPAADADAARRRAEELATARKQAEENVRAAESALERAREFEAAALRDVAEAAAELERAQQTAETARRARRAANEALATARASAG